MKKKFLGIIGQNGTKHFYEADVVVGSQVCEIEIQADSAGQARDAARAAGYELSPLSLKFIC